MCNIIRSYSVGGGFD